MARKKITQVTSKDIEGIINNSVQSAKNRLVGNAAEQKKMFVRPIANTDGTPNVTKLVQRLAEETEAALQEMENEVEDLQDSLAPPPPAESIPLSGVYLAYDRDSETLEVLGEKGIGDAEVRSIVVEETSEKFSTVETAVGALHDEKQDKIAFADGYNAATNKAATEATVAKEVAKVVGGADAGYDTLKEIADWIVAHPNSVAEINAKIAENTAKISVNARDIALNTAKSDRNTSDIAAQGQRINNVQTIANELANSKQNKLAFAGTYNAETNKVATEQTVADEIAKVVGGADASFDTLKEIADWIVNNPDSVSAINAKLSEHAQSIALNAEAIAENSEAIERSAEKIRQNNVNMIQNANAIAAQAEQLAIAKADIRELANTKQGKLEFADEYDPAKNKVATERTIARAVSQVVADAPEEFDTLKEIAAWITANPGSVATLNALIQENAQGISLNRYLITENTRTVTAQGERISKTEVNVADLVEMQKRLVASVDEKVGKTTSAKRLYGTDETGRQITYPIESVGTTVLVDGENVETFNADSKVDKVEAPNQLYGTDENGNPTLYSTDSVGTQVLVDGQKVKEFNADSKQNVVAFDGEYNAETNKAATVQTVTNKIAEVVANAPEDLNTLEEIAAWIAEHPESVAEINARIAKISSRVESVEKELPNFIEKEKVGRGLEYDDVLQVVTSIGALTARTGFPVTGDTMDDAWKEVATNNQATWTAEDWEKFYAFIGAVKDYHKNRNGLARFNDGKLDVTDGLVNSSSANVINGRVLYKQLEAAKTEAAEKAVKQAVEQTDATMRQLDARLSAQMAANIQATAKFNSYTDYGGLGGQVHHELVPGGFYMIFSGSSDLNLVDAQQGRALIDKARHMIFMTVPYSAEAKEFVAIGMYAYDGSFSITNPKIPMEFFQIALHEHSYVTAGTDSMETVAWSVAQHVGGINE